MKILNVFQEINIFIPSIWWDSSLTALIEMQKVMGRVNEKRMDWWVFCFVYYYRSEQREWSSVVLVLGRSAISCHGRWHALRDVTFHQSASLMDVAGFKWTFFHCKRYALYVRLSNLKVWYIEIVGYKKFGYFMPSIKLYSCLWYIIY